MVQQMLMRDTEKKQVKGIGSKGSVGGARGFLYRVVREGLTEKALLSQYLK